MSAPSRPAPAAAGRRPRRLALALILLVSLASGALAAAAARRTSTTFDEILFIATGARGYETGRFDMFVDHPPVMQYLYGLPVWLAHPRFPSESLHWTTGVMFDYARTFMFRMGNDPQRLAFRARAVGAAFAALLALVSGLLALRAAGPVAGPVAGVVAATLVAFLPDVLAHGGVAYDDLPLAFAFLLAAWAVDAALRRPGPRAGALAGLATALALGIKYSAILLLPLAALLLLAEGSRRTGEPGRGGADPRAPARRWRDPAWRRATLVAVDVALLACYLGLVLVYRGDFTLHAFLDGVRFKIGQATTQVGSAPAPAYLLGREARDGFWYFYPVAFLLKTPLALHALMLATAAAALLRRARGADGAQAAAGADAPAAAGGAAAADRLVDGPARLPLAALVATVPVFLRAELNIGFRHALFVLPFVCLLVACGFAGAWKRGRPAPRLALAALLVAYVASSASWYPWFLAYTSEYVRGRDRGYTALDDSSLDWGQGLLELRDFMRRERVRRVRLSYFGSALPAAYGIDYEPLPSFFALAGPAASGAVEPIGGQAAETAQRARPGGGAADDRARGAAADDRARGAADGVRFTVLSATSLVGNYLEGDPFAAYRARTPYRVLGHVLFVYEDGRDPQAALPSAGDGRRGEAARPGGG